MRKLNKILMATVSVLLSLVLVSTCLVSGVFAKYTTKKARTMTVGFEAFGVTLSMALGTGVTGTVVDSSGTGYSLTATVPSLKMAPGDAFYDALKVSVTGTSNVPVAIKMTCKIVYPDVAGNDNAYVYNGTKYMPLGFSCKKNGATSPTAICYSWQSENSSKISEIVMRNLANQVFGTTYSTNSSSNNDGNGTWFYEKSYAKGTNFSNTINEFAIGMYWPYEYGKETAFLSVESAKSSAPTKTTAVYDQMATDFASKNAAVSFVYTITITQVQSAS